MFETQVQGLVTEDQSQPSRRPETGAESATHEDTGTPGHVSRGERSASANQRTGSGVDLRTEDIGATSTWVLSFISCSKMFYLMHNMAAYQATSDCSRTWVQSPLQGFFVLDIAINITQ